MTNPFVKNALKHLSRADGEEAISMLILLGLKYFHALRDSESGYKLDIQNLRSIYVEACDSLEAYYTSGVRPYPNVKRDPPRRGRPDAMAHYPFSDSQGQVGTLLEKPDEDQRIFSMGSPARKRWVQKVYDDMCIGRSKMRVVDIPEALQSLGLRLSKELEKAVVRKGKKSADTADPTIPIEPTIDMQQWSGIVKKTMKCYDQGSEDSNDAFPRQTQPFDQHQRRRGSLVVDDGNDNNGDTDTIISDGDVAVDPAYADDFLYNSQQQSSPDCRARSMRDVKSRIADQVRQDKAQWQKAHNLQNREAMAALARRRLETLRQDSPLRSRAATLSEGEVLEARGTHRQSGHPQNYATSRHYLSGRSDYLTQAATASTHTRFQPQSSGGSRSQSNNSIRHYSVEKPAYSGRAGVLDAQKRTQSSRSRSSSRARHSSTGHHPRAEGDYSRSRKAGPDPALGRYGDLQSGTAAVSIADTFLHGALGREFLTSKSKYNFEVPARGDDDDDVDTDDMVAAKMDRAAETMLRSSGRSLEEKQSMSIRPAASSGPRHSYTNVAADADADADANAKTDTVRGERATSFPRPKIEIDMPAGNQSQMTIREREALQEQTRQARALYSQGWRNSKGGWVADFGPAHTHSLTLEPTGGGDGAAWSLAHEVARQRQRSRSPVLHSTTTRPKTASELIMASSATAGSGTGRGVRGGGHEPGLSTSPSSAETANYREGSGTWAPASSRFADDLFAMEAEEEGDDYRDPFLGSDDGQRDYAHDRDQALGASDVFNSLAGARFDGSTGEQGGRGGPPLRSSTDTVDIRMREFRSDIDGVVDKGEYAGESSSAKRVWLQNGSSIDVTLSIGRNSGSALSAGEDTSDFIEGEVDAADDDRTGNGGRHYGRSERSDNMHDLSDREDDEMLSEHSLGIVDDES